MIDFESQIIKPDKNLLKKEMTLTWIFAFFLLLAFFTPLGATELSIRIALPGTIFLSDTFWIVFLIVIPIVVLIIVLTLYFFSKKRINTIEYQIKGNKITITGGVFVTSTRSVVFEKIINVQKIQGILDRKYEIGTIILSTASQSGTAATTIRFSGLKEFNELYEQLSKLIEK
ncbi:MAG: PH domain-containing protein [Candidatus Thorarchaeota archaeon]